MLLPAAADFQGRDQECSVLYAAVLFKGRSTQPGCRCGFSRELCFPYTLLHCFALLGELRCKSLPCDLPIGSAFAAQIHS